MLAIAGMTLSACSGTNAASDAPQSFDGATATVERGDLVGETTVQGTLQYADSYTLKPATTPTCSTGRPPRGGPSRKA